MAYFARGVTAFLSGVSTRSTVMDTLERFKCSPRLVAEDFTTPIRYRGKKGDDNDVVGGYFWRWWLGKDERDGIHRWREKLWRFSDGFPTTWRADPGTRCVSAASRVECEFNTKAIRASVRSI
jgi:hypothetical protein